MEMTVMMRLSNDLDKVRIEGRKNRDKERSER